MFDLTRFSLSEMTRCGMALRRLGEQASGMEEVGERIVRYFCEHLRTPDLARPACVLVRVFVTQPYAALDDAQRNFALRVLAELEGDCYRFAVADNGPGIAPQYREKIWQIFQTLAPRDKVEGTGIGLSVVRKTVESRGGRTWLES